MDVEACHDSLGYQGADAVEGFQGALRMKLFFLGVLV